MLRGPMRVLLLGVPRHLRDSVHGDWIEQQADTREALGVVLHFQAEPWRDPADRKGLLLLAVAAAGLLWIVPMAVQALLMQAHVFTDAFSRAALALWAWPQAVAAVACGLLVGAVHSLPAHVDAARWQLVLLLAPAAAWPAATPAQALLAAALLAAGAALAHHRRRAPSGNHAI
jgi:hypothetical protein